MMGEFLMLTFDFSIWRSMISTTKSVSDTYFGCVKVHCLTVVGGVENFFFHHALTHGGHLRTAVGVDDGGNDIAAKMQDVSDREGLCIPCRSLGSLWSPISSEVQSAVSPLCRHDETRGPRSRPMHVAPIRGNLWVGFP